MQEIHTDPEHGAGPSDEVLRSLDGAVLWETDAAATFVSFLNAEGMELFGRPGDDGAGSLLRDHVHREDWCRVLECLNRAATDGGVQRCEHRMIRSDGSTMWALTIVQRRGRSNGVQRLLGISVDVTREREAHLALRESEALSKLLIETLRDYGVFMLTTDGRVASWSPGAQRMKRYRAEEVVGAPIDMFFPPDLVERGVPRQLLEKAEAERQADFEGWLLRKGGERFWCSLTLTAVEDHQGKLRGFSNVARDLTHRRMTEAALRDSEQRFRLLVESQELGAFMVSPEGIVESWNRGAQRLQGHRVDEIVGSPVARLFPPEEIERGTLARLLEEAARLGRGDYEGLLVRKNGDRFLGLMTVNAVEDESGRLRGFSMLARDVTARKQTEQALRQSEEYFRLLVQSVQDYGVFMLTLDGKVESWNQGAQRLKGYRSDEVIGGPISRFFPPEEREKRTTERLIEEAVLNGIATYEGWLVRKGGGRFWGLVTLAAVEDEHGHLRGISNVARDLTERKQAEDAMRESEERLRLLIDSLQDYGVFMLSPEGLVVSWSPGAERLQGHREAEILGAPFARLFSRDEIARGTPERLVARAAEEGRAEYEGWLQTKSGATIWGSLIVGAVREAGGGRLRGLSVITRDLTARMRADRAQVFLSEVASVLASSPDSRATLERVARLATRDLAAWCVVEIAGREVIEPIALAHRDPALEVELNKAVRALPATSRRGFGVAHVVQTGEPELKTTMPDGSWVDEALGLADAEALARLGASSYVCVPLTSGGATLGAILLVAEPDRRFGQEELHLAIEVARRAALALDNARLYEQAHAAVRLREEVLAVVSHDLRNPLTTILMGAERLLADGGEEERCKPATAPIAESIQRAAERMERMIRDLLDFSSIEAGKLRIETAAHDAGRLVEECVEAFAPMAGAKKIALTSHVGAPGVMVLCDHERIMQVFSNLVGNAVKFTPEGGSVQVCCRAEHGRAIFTVSDTGPGIREEQLVRVFDRYWQGGQARGSSIGLGLAISKAIIESHGGTISVESRLGAGTTFTFSLPAAGS